VSFCLMQCSEYVMGRLGWMTLAHIAS